MEIVNAELLEGTLKEPPVVTISYDEKPGIQALATTTPDLPPVPSRFPSHLRDSEYRGSEQSRCWPALIFTLAGSPRSSASITPAWTSSPLLSKLDESYPPQARIRLLLDNHSAHTSKQTRGWLSLHPIDSSSSFTPKHGSWLNIVETMFSKMARSMLRGIRVGSKQELIDRIHLYFEQVNADPVIFRWKYKMEETTIVQVSTER